MNMIKSKGLLLVLLVILAMGVTACGGKETEEEGNSDSAQVAEETGESDNDDSSNDSEEEEDGQEEDGQEEDGQEEDGQEQEVVVPDEDPIIQFTGFTNAAFGGMDATLGLYEDDVAIMYVNYAGRDRYLQGTWTKDDETSTISLEIEDTEFEINEDEDGGYSFDYPTYDGKAEVVIPFSTNAE